MPPTSAPTAPQASLAPLSGRVRSSQQAFTLVGVLIVIILIVLLAILVFEILIWWTLRRDGAAAAAAVGRVEVVPSTATVIEGSLFQIRARLRTSAGKLIPECTCNQPEWSFSPDDETLKPFGADPSPQALTLQAADDLTLSEKIITVTATVGGVSGTGRITVVKAPTSGDRIVGDHDRGAALDFALVTGRDATAGPGCADEDHDAPHAFAGVQPLGNLVEDAACKKDASQTMEEDGNVAVFSVDGKVEYTGRKPSFSWTAGSNDVVDVRSDVRPPAPITVLLAVWVSANVGTPRFASALATRDVGLANDIFRRNRTGIQFAIRGNAPKRITLGEVHSYPCNNFESYLDLSQEVPDLMDGKVVHVIYIKDTSITAKGASCGVPDQKKSGLIFIFMLNYMPTTLAHELGHMLGLTTPCYGHTKDIYGAIAGFESNNVMWTSPDPHSNILRDHFSLGQAFRMSLDTASWVYKADPKLRLNEPEGCEYNPYTYHYCPKLYHDIPLPTVSPADEVVPSCPLGI